MFAISGLVFKMRHGAQRGLVVCLKPHSKQVSLWDLNLSGFSLLCMLLLLDCSVVLYVDLIPEVLEKTHEPVSCAAWWISVSDKDRGELDLPKEMPTVSLV